MLRIWPLAGNFCGGAIVEAETAAGISAAPSVSATFRPEALDLKGTYLLHMCMYVYMYIYIICTYTYLVTDDLEMF